MPRAFVQPLEGWRRSMNSRTTLAEDFVGRGSLGGGCVVDGMRADAFQPTLK